MARKKIKLEEEAISEILVADTVSESKYVLRLESHHNKHWPAKSSTQLRCCLHSSHGQRKGKVYKCARRDVGLCMVPCLAEYHIKVNL